MSKDWIEETLDPEDWEEMKTLAKKMAEEMVTYHQNIREHPPLVFPTQELIEQLAQPLPLQPSNPEEVYKEFKEKIFSNHGALACHPGCWSTVLGTGTTFGALADMWMSGLNGISSLNISISSHVENQVVSCIKEMLGYPTEASGVLTSGGSIANLLALIVARDAKAGYDVKEEGCRGDLVFYGSNELHYCIQKNLESMGVGRRNLHKISTDNNFRINIEELKNQIEKDKDDGLKPVCVVGCAGSVNTGSIDDLNALAKLCKEYELWFHVDAAFGAWAALTPNFKHLVSGMEKADSVAVDLHKWMYMPYGIGVTLVRDQEAHYRSFREQADYVVHDRSLSDLTLELSKPFRSLKAWMSIKEHGAERYGRLIEQNILQAKYLVMLVEASPVLELLAPVSLNVVCFRYVGDGLSEEVLGSINGEGLRLRGFSEVPSFMPGETVVNGKPCWRVCFTNHRTTRADIDTMLAWVTKTGNELSNQ